MFEKDKCITHGTFIRTYVWPTIAEKEKEKKFQFLNDNKRLLYVIKQTKKE